MAALVIRRFASATVPQRFGSRLPIFSAQAARPLIALHAPAHARSFRATGAVQSSKRDPYSVLGVERTATPAEIKKQYYKAAKEHHPDANPNSPEAAKKFAEATEAYDLLSSEEKRREYDTYGHGGVPGGGGGGGGNPFGGYGMSMDDLFADLFAASLQVEVEISFLEAVRGCAKTVNWQTPNDSSPRSVELNIPAGVDDGMQLKAPGRGPPRGKGRPPADLHIVLRVAPHPTFIRAGLDIHVVQQIRLLDALFGAKISVPTLDGDKEVAVSAGTQPGDRAMLRAKGVRLQGRVGDFFVHWDVVLPKQLGAEQAALLKEVFASQPMPSKAHGQRTQFSRHIEQLLKRDR